MSWKDLIGEILRFLNNIFTTPKGQIQKVVSIYDSMHSVLEETPIERFLIFKAHNGGGIIRSTTPLYVSVIYEDYTHPFKSVKRNYQRLEVDEEYLRMLATLSKQRSIAVKTEDLPKGMLKNIYLGEGVKYAELYYLGQDKKNIYYGSIGTSQDVWKASSYEHITIQVHINNIRNNIF